MDFTAAPPHDIKRHTMLYIINQRPIRYESLKTSAKEA